MWIELIVNMGVRGQLWGTFMLCTCWFVCEFWILDMERVGRSQGNEGETLRWEEEGSGTGGVHARPPPPLLRFPPRAPSS